MTVIRHRQPVDVGERLETPNQLSPVIPFAEDVIEGLTGPVGRPIDEGTQRPAVREDHTVAESGVLEDRVRPIEGGRRWGGC